MGDTAVNSPFRLPRAASRARRILLAILPIVLIAQSAAAQGARGRETPARSAIFDLSDRPGALTPEDATAGSSSERTVAGSLGDIHSYVFDSAANRPPGLSRTFPADVDFTGTSTWKALFHDVFRDQKEVLTFPRQFAPGHHWMAAVTLTAATAGLVAVDPRDTPYFRRTSTFQRFNTVASGLNTGVAMALVPAVFYLSRSRSHDSYGKQTVYAAAEAIADVQILALGMKMLDRRIRPSDVPPGGDYANTWFKADVLGGKSFPSAHAITAFALAEVFVERYREHRWIPWVAYGLAAGVGLSRMTLQAHFPSDVFAGTALGIVLTHGVVLHRPAHTPP